MEKLSLGMIEEARSALAGKIRQTPVEFSPELSQQLKVPTFFKLESLQITGSFKLRGALYRLSYLEDAQRETGVATCSAGNHGWALAYAGRELGIPVTVYLPASVDESKRQGMLALGANVIVTPFPGYDEAEKYAKAEAENHALPFVSAFDDPRIMAANGGTIAAEILEEIPDAQSFLFPVGGGGLAAGASYLLARRIGSPTLIASQHRDSPALQLSLERGAAVTELPPIQTAAGGVEGGIGLQTFEVIRRFLKRVVLCSEGEILSAVTWFLDKHHYLIEPSSAVAVAAALSGRLGPLPPEKPLVIIITGRNVALKTVARILQATTPSN